MSPELLRLHIAQLTRTFEKSRTNNYADQRKLDYHNKLSELLKIIHEVDLELYDYENQKSLKEVLDFIFLSIEFLDNSTLTTIPHEIVYCLEKALADWDKTEQYIIVTSLNNNISGYSFNPILALSPHYYDIIDSLFNIDFTHRLIQINLPKYLVHDYLANVVLYHELGHFVEKKFKIAKRLTETKLLNGSLPTSEEAIKYFNHISENFADIFAAQYVGEASNYYLDYIAHKFGNSATHPSTDSRIEIVKVFIEGRTDNDRLNEIVEATNLTTSIDLRVRYELIDSKDFKGFVPVVINNVEQLHSVFNMGWDLWKTEVETFNTRGIDDTEKYQILNNLMEKSISNYMVMELWNH